MTMCNSSASSSFNVEESLKDLAESNNLIKWLSDVDMSKHVADWLVDEHGLPRWQVMLGLKLITPLIVSCGQYAGKVMSDVMKQKLLSRVTRFDWARNFIEKLENLRTQTSQQTQVEEALIVRLERKVDRSAGDMEHRKVLSIDLQAALYQMDMLDEMKGDLECIIGLLKPQPKFKSVYESDDERSRFIYRSQYIPFVGRDKELSFLDEFLYSDKRFCWQAILGPGGVGKSRLALEFCCRHGGVYRAGVLRNIKFDFENWIPCQPTLIVIDYATKDEGRLKEILEHLSDQAEFFNYNVRVLILDRENADYKLKTLFKNADLSRVSYSKAAYLLRQSEPELVKGIFNFFYEVENRDIPDSWSEHLEKLKTIDPLMRPLFAAYFAAALAKGGEGREYSRELLLLDVIEREENMFWSSNGVTESDKALLALATIVGGLSTKDDYVLPDCITSLSDLIRHKERFKALNCKVEKKSAVVHFVPPWEPDLVGEFFVLNFLMDDEVTFAENKFRKDVINIAWSNNPIETSFFLAKLSLDYSDHSMFSELIQPPRFADSFSLHFWATVIVRFIDQSVEEGDIPKGERFYGNLEKFVEKASTSNELVAELADATFRLIRGYSRINNFSKAEALYEDLMSTLNIHSNRYEIVISQVASAFSLIDGYVKIGNLNRAEHFYEDLVSQTVTFPDSLPITYTLYLALEMLCDVYGDSVDLSKLEAFYGCLMKLLDFDSCDSEIIMQFVKLSAFLISKYEEAGNLSKSEMIYDDLRMVQVDDFSEPEISLMLVQALATMLIGRAKVGELSKAEMFYTDLINLSASLSDNAEIELMKVGAVGNLVYGYCLLEDFCKAKPLYTYLTSLISPTCKKSEILTIQANSAWNLMLLADKKRDWEQCRYFYNELCLLGNKSDNSVVNNYLLEIGKIRPSWLIYPTS